MTKGIYSLLFGAALGASSVFIYSFYPPVGLIVSLFATVVGIWATGRLWGKRSYKFIAFLTLLSIISITTNAISALPPIWHRVAKQKCNNDDEICRENIRDSFIKEGKEFIKENPNKTYTDFTIKKCIELHGSIIKIIKVTEIL